MTRTEFQAWIKFWEMCPFDDQARYFRPAALLAQVMGGADVAETMRWLERETPAKNFSSVDMSFMAAFGFKAPPPKD